MNGSHLSKLILDGEFEEARLIKDEMNFYEFADEVMQLAFEEENLIVYTFISYLLTKKEEGELHRIACNLMCHAYKSYTGAYISGLYHARKAIECAPDHIAYREMLLFFRALPYKLISDQEIIEITEHILNIDPENEAVKTFQVYENK